LLLKVVKEVDSLIKVLKVDLLLKVLKDSLIKVLKDSLLKVVKVVDSAQKYK